MSTPLPEHDVAIDHREPSEFRPEQIVYTWASGDPNRGWRVRLTGANRLRPADIVWSGTGTEDPAEARALAAALVLAAEAFATIRPIAR